MTSMVHPDRSQRRRLRGSWRCCPHTHWASTTASGLSLAGMQAKLLLTRLPSGGFAQPSGATPTTHIVKPAIASFPGTCVNEHWCLTLADRAGLPAAQATVSSFGAHEVLVVERYDRVRDDNGVVHRVPHAVGLLTPAVRCGGYGRASITRLKSPW